MWTSDAGRLNEADAVWFHIPTFSGLPNSKPKGQKWVAMSMEGDGYYPKLKGIFRQFCCIKCRFVSVHVLETAFR